MIRLLLLLSLAFTVSLHAEEKRPNILWLIAEDFGPDLGCYGAKEVSSPVLDALAAKGMRFTRFYTTAPVCSASRSAFNTGMYQTTIGAQNHRSHRTAEYPLPAGVKVVTHGKPNPVVATPVEPKVEEIVVAAAPAPAKGKDAKKKK
ncbi:MAG: sulfatase-like hydrolase/transferase [Burkholderiales bacterium]|nr:sulfatase-like hydrolase/transferase [Burkholderiales bacterium]